MATLPQRFKLLATRCAAGAPSPSRSPAPSYATSPGYRLRRRRGSRLRRFLCRRVGGGLPEPAGRREEDKKPLVGRGSRTLRDLFVASPEAGRTRRGCGCDADSDDEEDEEEAGSAGSRGASGTAGGGGGRRFRAAGGGLRSLLMRRSWRPVLVAIPESEGGKIELGAIEE